MSSPPDGRTLHYGVFYGIDPLPPDDGRPLVVVVGNCQAESLRVLLDAAGSVRSVRVPPVFEVAVDEVARLAALVARADVLVAQPVRDGYRGMPLGTAQLAAHLPARGRLVVVPAIRYAGLYPYQVVLRVPGAGAPPGVPYADLRTIVEAATGRRRSAPLPAEGVREVAAASVAELRRREDAAGAVPVSDLLVPAGADAAHVINHPGNPVLVGLAARVQAAIGVPADAADPGRTLLREVYAPLPPEVVDALALDAAPRTDWTYRGEPLSDNHIRDIQLPWLAAHPQVVEHALARHGDTVRALGLA